MTIQMILKDRDGTVIAVDAEQTVAQVIQLLSDKRIGAVPVLEAGEVVGIFSERDIIYCLAAKGAEALNYPVSAVMTSPAITVQADLPALTALSLMTRRRIRHLPVVGTDGQIAGFVSIGDLVKYRIDRIETEASAMRDYIQGVT